MTTLSVVIPTCALAPHAAGKLSSGKQPYAFRAYLLQSFILPRLLADPAIREVIVVGEYERGVEYQYVPVPNQYQDNIKDALAQRDAGCRAATSDWIAVLADDHVPGEQCFLKARKYCEIGDVVSLNRQTRMRVSDGETLNSGMAHGYINGHGAIYRRDVLEACPWANVPQVFTYDMAHTQQIKDAGFHIVYAPDAYVEDVEYGATPWL